MLQTICDATAGQPFIIRWTNAKAVDLFVINPMDAKDLHWGSFKSLTQAQRWIEGHQHAGRNVYFHVNGGTLQNGRLTKDGVSIIQGSHVDIDPPDHIGPTQVEQWRQGVVNQLVTCPMAPTCITVSGRGVQAFWKFTNAVGPADGTIDRVTAMNRGLMRIFAGDKGATDVARILKLPGTISHPNEKKRAAGWGPMNSAVAVENGPLHDPVTLETWINQNAPVDPTDGPVVPIEGLDGPAPGYTGPSDDGELVSLMTSDQLSQIALAFDLTKTHDELAAAWNAGDGSSLDMTLANHLAYFTGGDLPRMERLFMQSVCGQREKSQKRPKYVQDTCAEAARLARAGGRFLNRPTVASIAERIATTTVDTMGDLASQVARLPAAERDQVYSYADDKNPAMRKPLEEAVQIEHNAFRVEQGAKQAAGLSDGPLAPFFIVLNDGGKLMVHDRRGGTQPMTKTDFIAAHSHLPEIPVPTGDKVKNIPAAVYWLDEPSTERYDRLGYYPGAGDVSSDVEGRTVRNIYKPAHTTLPMPADVTPYLHIVQSNFPDPHDQQILLGALAFAVQKPGERLLWAPVIQGVQGSGKGSMVEDPLLYCAGEENVGMPSSDNLAEQYNGYAYRKTTIVVDEIGEHSKATLSDIAERLKTSITQRRVNYRVMRKDAFHDDNFACWFFMTNHMDSMFAHDPKERRWAHLISALQTAVQASAAFHDGWWEAYRPDIVAACGAGLDWWTYYRYWWSVGGNEAVRAMLLQCQAAMPGRAPESTTKQLAVREGEPEMMRLIREAVDACEPGFRGGWVSSFAVKDILHAEGVKVPHGKYFGQYMNRLGYDGCTRFRPTPAETMRFPASGGVARGRLYYRKSCAKWCDQFGNELPERMLSDCYDLAQTVEKTSTNVVSMLDR